MKATSKPSRSSASAPAYTFPARPTAGEWRLLSARPAVQPSARLGRTAQLGRLLKTRGHQQLRQVHAARPRLAVGASQTCFFFSRRAPRARVRAVHTHPWENERWISLQTDAHDGRQRRVWLHAQWCATGCAQRARDERAAQQHIGCAASRDDASQSATRRPHAWRAAQICGTRGRGCGRSHSRAAAAAL